MFKHEKVEHEKTTVELEIQSSKMGDSGGCVQDGFQITCLTYYNFTVADYIIFSFMLVISAAVGVFFAYRSRNTETVEDYLLGNGRTVVNLNQL